MTEKTNVISINGKEYEESTMDGQQLYLITPPIVGKTPSSW